MGIEGVNNNLQKDSGGRHHKLILPYKQRSRNSTSFKAQNHCPNSKHKAPSSCKQSAKHSDKRGVYIGAKGFARGPAKIFLIWIHHLQETGSPNVIKVGLGYQEYPVPCP
jgi:hypothetical protein